MIDPDGLHLGGPLTYTAIMLILMPFGGWYLFASQLVLPSAGGSRVGAVIGLWMVTRRDINPLVVPSCSYRCGGPLLHLVSSGSYRHSVEC
jgi:hypothetical protein